jgi:putative ABC transport system ATP-binding protein
MSLLILESVSKVYPGTPAVEAVKSVSLRLEPGCFAVLVGPSGSGKTTLLNLISGLDQPTHGRIWLSGQEVTRLSPAELTRLRRDQIGFVFQSYNLFPVLTAAENVEYTALLRGEPRVEARHRAIEALALVGLGDKVDSLPRQLSGGQQQRVAVARALASRVKIVFADEPTANLDSKTAFQLIDLFERLNAEENLSFLFSTHDSRLVDRARERLLMQDGSLSVAGDARIESTTHPS